jgi:2-oxoglutarate dehydrogenase E1 component
LGYLDHLLKLGGLTLEEGEEIAKECHARLSQEMSVAETLEEPHPDTSDGGLWDAYSGGRNSETPEVDTGVDKARLMELLERLAQTPLGFNVHPKLKNGLQRRLEMARGERPLDWAAGEALAFASLAAAGTRIRFTGQDSERGTFSQRHAVLHDVKTGQRFMPLQHIAPNQGPVEIANSPLSESGVLGFEYGYSLDCPDGLVLWEAQYGDFYNAAQVTVDQFIASAEDKWRQLSGIVLLLPHGFEGGGPEHSSARVERFLTLAAEDNFQVVAPTTPAQYFHALRRQVVRPWRKPLVVMTPKSLLRHPRAVSSLDDCAGRFRAIIDDSRGPKKETRRVLLCSGKIYYELDAFREERKRDDVAIVRIEQLYPLDEELLVKTLSRYPAEASVVWVQEEPENMGAWRYLRMRFENESLRRLTLTRVSRPESASVATGSARNHKLEQERLLAAAFE